MELRGDNELLLGSKKVTVFVERVLFMEEGGRWLRSLGVPERWVAATLSRVGEATTGAGRGSSSWSGQGFGETAADGDTAVAAGEGGAGEEGVLAGEGLPGMGEAASLTPSWLGVAFRVEPDSAAAVVAMECCEPMLWTGDVSLLPFNTVRGPSSPPQCKREYSRETGVSGLPVGGGEAKEMVVEPPNAEGLTGSASEKAVALSTAGVAGASGGDPESDFKGEARGLLGASSSTRAAASGAEGSDAAGEDAASRVGAAPGVPPGPTRCRDAAADGDAGVSTASAAVGGLPAVRVAAGDGDHVTDCGVAGVQDRRRCRQLLSSGEMDGPDTAVLREGMEGLDNEDTGVMLIPWMP